MKKLVSVFVLTGIVTGSAVAAPSHIARDAKGGYNVTYNYNDKAKTGWYVAGRAGGDFLTFTNKYALTDPAVGNQTDKYSFEPVFGGSVAAGYRLNYFWRGEVEAGYIGELSDSDIGLNFKLSAPYLMANAYYDFISGVYVGGGIGLAIPRSHIDGASNYFTVIGGDRNKTGISPMLGAMLGYSKKLDDNLVLDLRYRLAGFNGVKQRLDYENEDGTFVADVKNGLILDNSFSVGLRYEF